jgi:subtilisin family serine protease
MTRTSPSATVIVAATGVLLFQVLITSQGRRVGNPDIEDFNNRPAAAREVLVKLRTPLTGPRAEQLGASVDADNVEPVGRRGLLRIRSRSRNVAALVAAFSNRPDVEYAEPNYIVHTFEEPNDPLFPLLWGLKNIGQAVNGAAPGTPGADISAVEGWDLTLGTASNVVGVVDTGIDYNHPDLAPNVWSAPAPFTVVIGGAPINCAAGTHGFNAIDRTCDPMDDHNHGTHVSGTIGAVGNNGVGVAGVNWVTKIMGLKFLSAGGSGSVADAVVAMDFAMQVKAIFAGTGGANIRILSNSWGGGGFSQAFLDQVKEANDEEMLFVAAAGNSGISNDFIPAYPASYAAPNVVAVLATTSTDTRASFSNYGVKTVHLGAPGVNVASTIRGGAYAYASGTSMATPHVSGAGALVLSHCALTTEELKDTLVASTDAVAALSTFTISGGRLNVRRAMNSCSSPPLAPQSLTASAGDKQVRLAWTAGTNATTYRVKRSTTQGGPYALVASNIKTLQYVDTGLANGTTYYYVVTGANILGESGPSPEASATPALPPDVVVFSFSAPASAAAGSQVPVSVTTKNQGTGSANESKTRFYISANGVVDSGDIRIDEAQTVPALGPGLSATVSMSITIPSSLSVGSHYLLAKADADDVLFEVQETNNTYLRTLTVGPDLIVSVLTLPAVAAPGAAVVADYTVRNQGATQAGASTVRFFWSANSSLDASDTQLGQLGVAPIDGAGTASGQATLTIPAGAGTGTHYVIAEADSLKVVTESSEINNAASRAVLIGGDLVVSVFDAPAAGGVGVPLTISDTTKNTGASSIGASVTHFYLSADAVLTAVDPLIGTRSVEALAAGQASVGTTAATIPAGTAAGYYYLFARADGPNVVTETQEGNNGAIRSFGVGPDLIVSITSTPWPILAGTPALVKDNVSNRGGGGTGAFVVNYHLSTNYTLEASDPLLTSRSIDALSAGASNLGSFEITVPAGTAPGYYYVIARADAGSAVPEVSETNNYWQQLIRVN